MYVDVDESRRTKVRRRPVVALTQGHLTDHALTMGMCSAHHAAHERRLSCVEKERFGPRLWESCVNLAEPGRPAGSDDGSGGRRGRKSRMAQPRQLYAVWLRAFPLRVHGPCGVG